MSKKIIIFVLLCTLSMFIFSPLNKIFAQTAQSGCVIVKTGNATEPSPTCNQSQQTLPEPNLLSKVPLYKQWNSAWAAHGFGGCGKTIQSSGCGITSLAMVISYWTGKQVLPSETADVAIAHHWDACATGDGTSWSAMTGMPPLYGLKGKEISWNEAKTYLTQGIPVIQAHTKGYFTDGGHFIVLTGIFGGNYLVNDPDGKHRTIATESQINDSSLQATWVITK